MNIPNLKLSGTFAELEAIKTGYKIVNTSSDAKINIVLGKKLFDKKFVAVVDGNVIGEFTDLLKAVKKLETIICMEVELGVWSDFALEGLEEVA